MGNGRVAGAGGGGGGGGGGARPGSSGAGARGEIRRSSPPPKKVWSARIEVSGVALGVEVRIITETGSEVLFLKVRSDSCSLLLKSCLLREFSSAGPLANWGSAIVRSRTVMEFSTSRTSESTSSATSPSTARWSRSFSSPGSRSTQLGRACSRTTGHRRSGRTLKVESCG